jgi:ABC-type glycerol-3-phosphate transport system substrate-binding protein
MDEHQHTKGEREHVMNRNHPTSNQPADTVTPRRRVRTRAFATLAVLALLAAACGGDDAATPDAPAAPDAPAPSEDGGELTVWFAREYYVPPNIDEFEAATGISVTVDVQPDDDLFQQLIRMADAGQQMPDIVHLDGFLLPVVAGAGVVIPIQDVVDQWAADDPDGFAEIYDATWEEGTHDGVLYGMANSASMEEVFFRNDWLEEAGVTDAPTTWDEVLDAARAIKQVQPGATAFGWWAARGNGANHVFASMTAMGVEFDGSTPNLQSPAGEYWISFIQTLAREELLSREAIAWSDDEMRGGFVGSNVGMMLDSAPTSLDAEEAGLVAGENFLLVPMPTSQSGTAAEGVITAPARSFFLTSDAEARGNVDAAGLFLRFIMDPSTALQVMIQGGDPARTDAVLGDSAALAEWMPVWDDDNVEAFADLGVFPIDVHFPASEEVMERFNEFVVDNPDLDPAAIAAQWQAEFDAVRG